MAFNQWLFLLIFPTNCCFAIFVPTTPLVLKNLIFCPTATGSNLAEMYSAAIRMEMLVISIKAIKLL